MRQVILYIAMSVDGYIADSSGGVEWLGGQEPNSEALGSYPEFIQSVDTVVMGWKTYYQIITELSPDEWVYKGKRTYVLTHRKHASTEDVEFTNRPLEELIKTLRQQSGKAIWICGGASIVNQLIKEDLIDRYHLTIMPMILGEGIRLFEGSYQRIKLKLIDTECYNGMTDLVYERRE